MTRGAGRAAAAMDIGVTDVGLEARTGAPHAHRKKAPD